MASLGSFGAAAREYEPPAEPDTFDFCGETFTVRGTIPGMIHLTVGAAMSGKISGVDGAAAIWDALRYALTEPAQDGKPENNSEWLHFYDLAVRNGVETEEIANVAYELLGAETGRPTVQRSGSSAGPLRTGTPSNSSSSVTPDSPGSPPADEASAG